MASSGIAETYGEKQSLLDDLILEMDERAEATRVLKEEQNMNEQRLIRVGESIRERALKRSSITDRIDSTRSQESMVPAKKRMRKSKPSTPDDAISTFLSKQAQEQQRLDADRVKIERDKFELQQKESLQRLELDQQRFELKKRERMQAMEERNKVLNTMDMLGRKLQQVQSAKIMHHLRHYTHIQRPKSEPSPCSAFLVLSNLASSLRVTNSSQVYERENFEA
ncbi:hypothetical protein BWQ96_07578 [Gracilariopsis chorda]|uniref:Uncharacterized protein n=1 Tax=Gracilariopsis chorda TaxID=448386 RepID=A0A2V3IKT4_9FLOR|nr:hypothetical protein BWQ96_07578 [Gracilariopsis chorda]|eukprot:PXF42692.1 hypothetical protein BWQ96_07578 [Gracilariopsis chorda]